MPDMCLHRGGIASQVGRPTGGRASNVEWRCTGCDLSDIFEEAHGGCILCGVLIPGDLRCTNALLAAHVVFTEYHWKEAEQRAVLACVEVGAGVDQLVESQGDRQAMLHVAATQGRLHVIRLLTKLGANVNLMSGLGYTPLWTAMRIRGRPVELVAPTVALLLRRRADATIACGHKGDTALHRACHLGARSPTTRTY